MDDTHGEGPKAESTDARLGTQDALRRLLQPRQDGRFVSLDAGRAQTQRMLNRKRAELMGRGL
ncbi:hypothetical protein BD830_11054 [Maritimibacter alkaliphilus HTCC2654]|uniref:Uncharacterized protein n=1 Tax=Maritimibacter alkaliphilus HTCC2654 TaxID=314271 RepID=A3VK78_9RHOB|nr:hypothetical protein [Maritimibacter alkaliphilus]EAQ11383.1 hypothetical protein RB2654_23513 [Rhodobacterales bacterium HTCC2654] [Maritimibacter alkaliphilus HTCC2654]TYP80089.1 hypothetical protein BD830_11054 [Maritimibacter alkaliphilus HTCC2654]